MDEVIFYFAFSKCYSTSGEEKCIMIEGYKYFFGEKGLLLRAEPMDKADLEKLENTEEKRALEKKMAREWKRIAKAAIAYHNHQEVSFLLFSCRDLCLLCG